MINRLKQFSIVLLAISTLSNAYSQISGTVTVGNGGNYSNITQVMLALNTNGVSGHTTVEILPGTYNENIYLDHVSGLSVSNTLTIQAQNGFGTVLIETLVNNPTSSLIEVYNSPHVTFKNLEFGIGNQNLRYVKADTCHYLTWDNCQFKTPLNTQGNSGEVRVENSNHISFLSCMIPMRMYLYRNIHLQVNDSDIQNHAYTQGISGNTMNVFQCDSVYMNNTTVHEYGVGGHARVARITNCTIPFIGFQGWNYVENDIWVENCTITDGGIFALSGQIRNNTIGSIHPSEGLAPIQLTNCINCVVSGNKIEGALSDLGIKVHGKGGLIANNMIEENYSNVVSLDRSGIEVSGKIQVLFNSVYLKNATAITKCSNLSIKHSSLGDSVVVKKNIFYVNHALGTAIDVSSNVVYFESDSNLLINEAGPIARIGTTNYFSMSQWNTASGKDLNSISVVPAFVAPTDLHLANPTGILLVQPSPNVPVDMDGEMRLNPTTIGADQNLDTYSTITETACQEYTGPSGINYTQSGTYYDTITNTVGYDSIVQLNLTITPDIGITLTDNLLTVNESNANYQWVNCANNFSFVTDSINQTFFLSDPAGSYAVIVNSNGCIDTSECFIYDVASSLSLDAEKNITIHPSPTYDEITISTQKSLTNTEISVYNVEGKEIYNHTIPYFTSVTIKLSGNAGVYFIAFKNQGLTELHRVIKL